MVYYYCNNSYERLKWWKKMKEYTIITQKNNSKNNGGNPYIILERSYYSKKDNKYVKACSMFINKELAMHLILLGVRLFDNANLFTNDINNIVKGGNNEH